MLQIYLEDETSMRKSGLSVPRQYVMIDGEKYYFPQEYIVQEYTQRDAEIDQLRTDMLSAANIKPSMLSHKEFSSKYRNIGLLPSGNMIVNYPRSTRWGIINAYGDVEVDFIYNSIKQIPNHPGFFIVESYEYYDVPEVGYMKNNVSYYEGIIAEDGTELFSIKDSQIDCIDYDNDNDVIHCNNYENWRGLASAQGWSGFDKDILTIPGNELEAMYELARTHQNSIAKR